MPDTYNIRFRINGGADQWATDVTLPFEVPGTTGADDVYFDIFSDTYEELAVDLRPQAVTNVAGDGWQATWPTPPDDVTGGQLFVLRQGHQANAEATIFEEAIAVTARVREPGVATNSPDTVSLARYIYAGETLTGATNASTLPYPYAQFAWMVPDFQEVVPGQNSITLKIAVSHRHARNGKPVAGVRFIVTDHESGEASQLVTACTGETYTASGFTASIYEGVVDITGLSTDGAQGNRFTIDAEFLPWVGTVHKISVITAGKGIDGNTVLTYGNNRNNWRQRLYAYVSPAGNDSTAVVSTTAATAQASPYATSEAANQGLRNWHDANTGRGALDGCVMRLEEGTHVHAVWTRRAVDDYVMIMEGAPGTDPANVIYTDPGSSTRDGFAKKILVRNLTLRKSSASSVIFLESDSATADNFIALINVDISDGGHGTAGNMIRDYKGSYFENCTQNTTLVAATKVIGCNGNFLAPSTSACVASRIPSGRIAPNTADRADGIFVGWSFISVARSVQNQPLYINFSTSELGVGLVGNVFESWGPDGAGASFVINGDGTTQTSKNINIFSNTFVGGRLNISYTDAGGSVRRDHLAVMRFNVFLERNTKSGDFFGYIDEPADPARVGNWNIRYGVESGWNTIIKGQSQDEPPNGFYALSWLGDVQPEGSITGSTVAPLAVVWTNDQSGASGTGNGDYRPASAANLATIPSGLAPYPTDMLAAATTAGGVSGALQLAA